MRLLTPLLSLCLLASMVLAPASARAKDDGTAEPQEGTAPEIPVEIDPGRQALDIVFAEPELASKAALLHNAELLDRLLEKSTKATIREQKFAAAAGITGGMIMLGLSAWRLIESDPQSAYSRGLGVMFMTLGMADLTTGVYAATRVSHERRRLERWQKARKNGITNVELAHFEGELQSSSETRNGERLLVKWNALTHAIAGVLILAFTPIPDGSSSTDRASGYIVGGLFFGVGIATFAASFRPTPSERAWEAYTKQKQPVPGHEFSWRLSPSVMRRGGGLSFGATF
jgi:hypothetical protein